MNSIKQKQIEDLVFDISRLYVGSDVFNRETTYTLGTPGEGEAHLDNQTANLATTLIIHTKDSITGNRFTNLESFQKHDTLIIQTSSGDVAKYNIISIRSDVGSSNEGHFILTIQHSFGYSANFSTEKMSYYLRRSASDYLIPDLNAELTFFQNRIDVRLLMETMLRSDGDNSKKKVFNETLSSSVTTITHDMNDEDVIVQVVNPSGSVVDATINNFKSNSVDITVGSSGTYKIIIIK